MHPSMDPFNNPTLQLGVLGGTCLWWLCPCPWRGGEACCPPRRRDWAGGRAGAGGGHRGGPGAHTARRPGSARSSRARTHGPVHVKKISQFCSCCPGSRIQIRINFSSWIRIQEGKIEEEKNNKNARKMVIIVVMYICTSFMFFVHFWAIFFVFLNYRKLFVMQFFTKFLKLDPDPR